MEIEYIIEICVAIDIAILGIAYPIIVDKISNIGDKYSSEYLSVLFNNEFPQRPIKLTIGKRLYQISFLKLILYTTIFSFIFLILKMEPLFGWNNFLINNSAKLTVLLLSTTLTIFFFLWLDKVSMYNGKSSSLLKSVVAKYSKLKDNTEIKSYYLKAINEITLYSIEKQDEHLQKTLLEFYFKLFKQLRKNHDKSKPFVYPIDIYFLIDKLNVELSNSQNKKLRAIEHRAVSGIWLLGEDFEDIKISDETFKWLWHNLYTICDHERFIKMFWANSSQYFDYRLKNVNPEYDYQARTIINKFQIDQREEERKNFLELHYALGGLLLYRKQFKVIKYIFEYTQSQPPRYVLLPGSMTAIFTWFEHFRNEFKTLGTPIDLKYYFPELDNLGNRQQVNFWICRYLSLLFIRQYSLHTYYVYEDFTSLPQLPDDVNELNNWLDSVSFFEKCLKITIEDDILMKELLYHKVIEENREGFSKFINELKTAIIAKIGEKKFNAELSEEKVQAFNESTNKIITEAFAAYKTIFNPLEDNGSEDDLKLFVNGSTTLISKSAFTDNDIPNINFDSVFADHIASDKIKRYIPNSFAVSKTRRYLLNKQNLVLALGKIIGQNKEVAIVALNIDYDVEEIIEQSPFSSLLVNLPSTDAITQGVLFVLKRSDLPTIEHRDLKEDEIENKKLKIVNESLKLYTSVIDINTPENKEIKEKWSIENEADNLDLKVQLTIAFLSVIYWKKDRDIIEINIASEFKEQGIQSDINEVVPLNKG